MTTKSKMMVKKFIRSAKHDKHYTLIIHLVPSLQHLPNPQAYIRFSSRFGIALAM